MKHPSAPHVLDLAKALRGVLCSAGLDTGELRQTKMPIETPRVNKAIVPATTNGKKYVNAAFARRLERESYVLMDFINTEMKMTATDPRIGELAERLAAVSNVELTHHGKKNYERSKRYRATRGAARGCVQ